MKPFDIEKAKQRKPVCNRAGENVRILCFDRKGEDYHIVALHTDKDGEELVCFHTNKGRNLPETDTQLDLFMKTEKKEGWINVYKTKKKDCNYASNAIYQTFELAYENKSTRDYVTTTKIEWEE